MNQFFVIAPATFVSEDLTSIGRGALMAAGQVGFFAGLLACAAGIYVGALLLYFAGRLIGRPVLRWRPLRRLLSDQKLDRASRWRVERGADVVILSRFTPASLVWTPALVVAAVVIGKSLCL